MERAEAEKRDAGDPLRSFRDQFVIADEELIYLDGNSLGRLPIATRDRLREVIEDEWGTGLIRSWAGWMDLSRSAGDLIAPLIDARPGEVIVADSTSVNLYKLAAAALDARPDRTVIITDDDNFPTDRYLLAGLATQRGAELRVVRSDPVDGVSTATVAAALDPDTALVCLSHVAYRSGAVADLTAITAAAHAAGALVLWDLSHSVGSVPVPLGGSGADLAVGCTYKHLHGGPGAPAFLFVRSDLQSTLRQPMWGWWGQRDQFAMAPDYEPVEAIERFLVGTPAILGLTATIEGARITAVAGIEAIAAKAQALTAFAIELSDLWLVPLGFELASPRDPQRRGAHVALRHPAAWPICQALIAAGVIPDFRAPDRLRLGLAPLYTRFADVYDGLHRLRELVQAARHLEYPTAPARVT